MFLTTKKADPSIGASAARAAKRTRAASTAAAANATQAAAAAATDTAQAVLQTATEAAQTAAQNAAVVASNVAQTVAQNASDVAQTAAANVTKGVRQGVFSARRWAAPRIEGAADYTTGTVAPKVAAVLRNTAQQVDPPSTGSRGKSILKWTALGAGIAAGLGAVAALVRFRYRAAIEADTEQADEDTASSAADLAAPGDTEPEAASAADTSVNGRVPAAEW